MMMFPFRANHVARMGVDPDVLLTIYIIVLATTILLVGGLYKLAKRCNKKSKTAEGVQKPRPYGHLIHPANENLMVFNYDYDEYSII